MFSCKSCKIFDNTFIDCFCILKISVVLTEFNSSVYWNRLRLQNQCKIFTVSKIKKIDERLFPAEYVFLFGHMVKIKTSANIFLRKIERNNQLLNHPFFCRLWSNQLLLLPSYLTSEVWKFGTFFAFEREASDHLYF